MDRFFRGLIAGMTGGFLMTALSLFSYHILNYATRRYHDWASVLIYGHLPQNLVENLISFFTQIIWAGFLGVIFAYFIPKVTSRGYLIKGAFWGFVTGFLQFSIAILTRMPYFSENANGTVVTQTMGGIIWGLTLAYVLRRLDTTPLKR